MYLILCLMGSVLLVWFLFAGLSSRASSAHTENQIRLPGRLAIELGKDVATDRPKAWSLWFEDAIIRFGHADHAWWVAYRHASGRRKTAMAAQRLELQKDIGEFIDPIECLRQLGKIAQQSLDETKTPRHKIGDTSASARSENP